MQYTDIVCTVIQHTTIILIIIIIMPDLTAVDVYKHHHHSTLTANSKMEEYRSATDYLLSVHLSAQQHYCGVGLQSELSSSTVAPSDVSHSTIIRSLQLHIHDEVYYRYGTVIIDYSYKE